MSAFIVTTETIAVVALWTNTSFSHTERMAVADALIAQNKKSVDDRYRDDNAAADRPTIELFDRVSKVSAFRAIGAIRCWRYQSCETNNHNTTAAWLFSTIALANAVAFAGSPDAGDGWDLTKSELA